MTLVAMALVAMALTGTVSAGAAPVPPCPPDDRATVPARAPAGAPPAVVIWRDLSIAADTPCLGPLRGPAAVVVALAGRLGGSREVDDIAERLGAVAKTEGLRYWSTTEQRWRVLIEGATAVSGANGSDRRADFSAAEIMSGEPLHFLQNDTRSTGDNLYLLRAVEAGPARLVIEIVNISDIRFSFVTLFEAGTLRSLHFFDRLGDGAWGYYGLSSIRTCDAVDHEKSLVNRAAAFHRFLDFRPGDGAPPLAP